MDGLTGGIAGRGGGHAAGLSRYQWRKQSSALMRGTEMCGTGVRRMALEPLAPIPATQPGSPVKTGKSVPIKVLLQTRSASQKSSFSKSQLYFFHGFDR